MLIGNNAYGRAADNNGVAATILPRTIQQALIVGEAQLAAVQVFFADEGTDPRQPLSRDRLMSLARGREHEAFERSMDVTIARLRRLLEDDPRQPRLIQTVWGVGYVFVPPEAAP